MNNKEMLQKVIIFIILHPIFIALSFIMFISFVHFRFIEEYLPKEIPFDLMKLWLYILLYMRNICIIKQTIFPRAMKNIIIQKILSYIGLPFITFDHYIKNFINIKDYYEKLISDNVPKLEYWMLKNYVFWIYLSQIIPRMIFVGILLIDVLKLEDINISYYFIPLGLLPLIYKYCKYSLEYTLELILNNIWYYEECVLAKEYVDTVYNKKMINNIIIQQYNKDIKTDVKTESHIQKYKDKYE